MIVTVGELRYSNAAIGSGIVGAGGKEGVVAGAAYVVAADRRFSAAAGAGIGFKQQIGFLGGRVFEELRITETEVVDKPVARFYQVDGVLFCIGARLRQCLVKISIRQGQQGMIKRLFKHHLAARYANILGQCG